MTMWLVRAGRHGEYEERFLDEDRIYLTWSGLSHDLGQFEDKDQLRDLLTRIYPNFSSRKVSNHTGQIWAFSHRITERDWVALPSKLSSSIHIAEVTGPYQYHPDGPDPFFHSREVNWIARDIPRSSFDQDILYSLGAFMTVCRIERNDAERRVREMQANGWRASVSSAVAVETDLDDSDEADAEAAGTDLEEIARDQVARLIQARFKGHGMALLVEAILKAQGYTVHRSPEGPDKGIDLLAAPGAMGFGQPRLCVQVKSGDTPLDRPTLDQLLGAMQNVQAEHGLLVSWGGFKTTVTRERATQFFRVRLWDSDDLVDQILRHYDSLEDDLRADLPLKRIWTVALVEDSQE